MFPLAIVLGLGLWWPDDRVGQYGVALAIGGAAVASWHLGLYVGVIPERPTLHRNRPLLHGRQSIGVWHPNSADGVCGILRSSRRCPLFHSRKNIFMNRRGLILSVAALRVAGFGGAAWYVNRPAPASERATIAPERAEALIRPYSPILVRRRARDHCRVLRPGLYEACRAFSSYRKGHLG